MDRLRNGLLALGLPGLFLIALLDSAGIPLPGGVDLVILLLAWQRPSLFLVVAATAAIGSAIGSLFLHRIGRTGGEVALRRLDPERRARVTRRVRENDVLAILTAVIAPAPFPTKVVVLIAGAVGMSSQRFVAAVLAGRLVRYGVEAYLAMRLGDHAVDVLRDHYPLVGGTLVALVVLYLLVHQLRKRTA